MKLQTLQDLYIGELKDLYSAENQIIKALPTMANAASCPNLKAGFEAHFEQTKGHVTRLEQILRELDATPGGKFCKGAQGFLEEGAELMKGNADPEVLDAGLISAAQRVEHYEIAGYGTCVAYAKQLGHSKAAEVLELTLMEEKQADKKLTEMAVMHINPEAVHAGSMSA